MASMGSATTQAIWVSPYSSDGTMVQTFSLPFTSSGSDPLGSIVLSNALAADSQGNIVLAGTVRGTGMLGSFQLKSQEADLNDMFIATISPVGDVLEAEVVSSLGGPYS